MKLRDRIEEFLRHFMAPSCRFDWCHCLETQLAGLISYARDLKLRGQVCINVISNTHEYDIVRGADDLLPVLNKAIEGMPRLNPSASSNIHVHFDETYDLIIQLGTRIRQENFPRREWRRLRLVIAMMMIWFQIRVIVPKIRHL